MKKETNLLVLGLCILCASCTPGKFASRLDGVVIDNRSSKAVSGVTIHSDIPHRESHRVIPPVVTDEEGRFSLPPEYGVFKLLTLSADWRMVTLSKEGYKPEEISVMIRSKERYVTYEDRKIHATESSKDDIEIKIEKDKNG